jgi:hypothetical protein
MKCRTATSSSAAGWLKSISRPVVSWARMAAGSRRSASMTAVLSWLARMAVLCAIATGSMSA